MQNIRYIFLFFFLVGAPAAVNAQQWKGSTNLPMGGTDGSFGFSIGDKLYFGGGSGVKTFYQFDPATTLWTKRADVPATSSARAFAVGFSIGSFGYMALGQDGGVQSQVKGDLWQYDPAQDKWTKKADFPGAARDGAFSFVIGGKAYVGGGSDAAFGLHGDFYSYDAATDTWTALGNLPTGPPMFQPNMIFAAAFVLGNFGYMATGSVSNVETTDLYQYDPVTDAWTKKAPFPGVARQAASGFSLYGKGYVGLGMASYDSNQVFSDFYSYDPVKDKWSNAGAFAGTRRAWASSVQTNSAAYVGGGWSLKNAPFFIGWWRFDTVSAIPTKPGYITLMSPMIDFGTKEFGKDSTSAAVVINSSWKTVIIDSMHITGPDATDFSVAPNTVILPYPLQNHPDTLPLGITFMASAPARTENAMLTIYFDGLTDSTRSAVLRGTSKQSTQSVEASQTSSITVAPNPFNDRTTITITGARDGMGSMQVYDLLGRVVYSSGSNHVSAGQRLVSEFDAKSLALPEGVYYLNAFIGSSSFERKLLFIR